MYGTAFVASSPLGSPHYGLSAIAANEYRRRVATSRRRVLDFEFANRLGFVSSDVWLPVVACVVDSALHKDLAP